jgi:hypothetical protein
MVPGFNGPRHLTGHFVLPAPALPSHAGNGTVEEFDHELLAGRFRSLSSHQLSHC